MEVAYSVPDVSKDTGSPKPSSFGRRGKSFIPKFEQVIPTEMAGIKIIKLRWGRGFEHIVNIENAPFAWLLFVCLLHIMCLRISMG